MSRSRGLRYKDEHQLEVEFIAQAVIARHRGVKPVRQFFAALAGQGPQPLIRPTTLFDALLYHQAIACQAVEAAVDLPAVYFPITTEGCFKKVA